MTVSHVQSFGQLPVGSVATYAGTNPPPGWLFCNGSELPINSYPQLYNALTNNGATFPYGPNTNGSGGAGSTHFRLPNMNNRFAIHKSSGVGGTGGANTHDHPFTTSVVIANSTSAGGHSHTLPISAGVVSLTAVNESNNHGVHNYTGPISIPASTSTVTTGGNTNGSGFAATVGHNHTINSFSNSLLSSSLSVNTTHTHTANFSSPNMNAAANHEQDHLPNANALQYVNQVTYQASSSNMQAQNSTPTNTKIRAIIKT